MAADTRLMAHLQALVGKRHPVSSPEKLKETEHYLTEQFRRLGLDVTVHSFAALGGTYRNLIGTAVSPSTTDDQALPPLIVAAHVDTVPGSPGADDNASGLAVLLEVARRVRDMTLARPVQFIAFNLEEEDLLGSLAYARELREADRRISGAIVLECVGYARDEEGSQKIPPGVPVPVPTVGNFLAVIGNQHSHVLTMSVEGAMNAHLPIVPLVIPGNGELLPDTRRSDHAAFWHYGYSAVMLTDTANYRNPHYHRSTDTIETLNLDFMSRVVDGVAAAVAALACQGSS
jgi:Zn-dependent M28 family amino/carboxypeptidase